MNRSGGCASLLLAFTIAGGAILIFEAIWPYLLATLLIACVLGLLAAARRPAAPVPALSMAKAVARRDRVIRSLARTAGKDAELRNRVIRAAAAAGLTSRKIAELAGISFQRVHQIVKDPAA